MVRSNRRLLRGLAIGVAAALTLAACGGGGQSVVESPGGTDESAAPSDAGRAGGTLYMLKAADNWDTVDPQRMYTGEDLAFFGGTIMRSLEAYQFSADPEEGTTLVPDLATDLGTASDGGKTWTFTLRDGVTWQDGSELTCEDVKYGVSRTFAVDIIQAGPTYAIAYLDIPAEDDPAFTDVGFATKYHGPYRGDGQELFDQAVSCEGKTITFHLKQSIADFNYTTTLGMAPVRAADDPGNDQYGEPNNLTVSNGPYMIESYTTGNGGKMILVRNPNWDPNSDGYRKAYPDTWEVHFGIDDKVIDQRLIQSSGNDQWAVQYGQVQPENLAVVFADAETPTAQFASRAISGFDPYSRYYWINTTKVTNVKIRQAMAVALNREAIRLNAGGAFAGDFADGVVKPNIGQDYAPTGFYTEFFGKEIPGEGDPALAMQLIEESGEAAPEICFNHVDSEVNARAAAIVIESLGRAGIEVTAAPLPRGDYYGIVFDPDAACEFGVAGWGPDWPNASTILGPLFTLSGGFDLSQWDDPDFNAKVEAALSELDRATQATLWQALNKEAAEKVLVIPTLFGRSQTIAGTKVGPIYRWSAYGSWPYGEMYALP
jgi:peptide/nickel transport system substrate-binding protein